MSAKIEDVTNQIRNLLLEHMPDADAYRSGKTALSDDTELDQLGIDSLDAIEIVFSLEEIYDIEIPMKADLDEKFRMQTISELSNSVWRLVNA